MSTHHVPTLNIPTADVTCVEFPGVIQNLDNAISSLGGRSELEKSLRDGRTPLALRLHPSDKFRRPIISTKVDSSDLLLRLKFPKMTGRRRKKGSSESFEFPEDHELLQRPLTGQDVVRHLRDNPTRYDVEMIGKVKETHLFRSIPDFQYSTATSHLANSMRNHIFPNEYPKIKRFKIDFDTKDAQPGMDVIPPPMFATRNTSFQYAYNQALGVKLSADSSGKSQSYNEQTTPKAQMHNIPWNNWTIPDRPPSHAKNYDDLSTTVQIVIERLKQLLNERPVITRRYALCKIREDQAQDFKFAPQYVAYSFKSGPWRDCIIKFGVDPRTHPKYAQFQALTFHVEPETSQPHWMTSKRGERGGDRRSQRVKNVSGVFIFDGKTHPAGGRTWQVCDIVDPFLRPFFETPLRDTCDRKVYGWIQAGVLGKVRVILKDKMQILTNGGIPDNTHYQIFNKLSDNFTNEDISNLKLNTPLSPKQENLLTELRKQVRIQRSLNEKHNKGSQNLPDNVPQSRDNHEGEIDEPGSAEEVVDDLDHDTIMSED